jgi:hypothetical protein
VALVAKLLQQRAKYCGEHVEPLQAIGRRSRAL